MMHRTQTVAALVAFLPLAACGQSEPEVVTARAPDPLATQINAAAPIALPPSIKASVTFRCKDNSVLYIDFFDGDTQANLRTEKGGALAPLTAATAGEPFTGGGYSVTGSESAVEVTGPGGTRSCTA